MSRYAFRWVKFVSPYLAPKPSRRNDLIENTNTKQKLIEFQQSRKLGTYGFEKGKVTKG